MALRLMEIIVPADSATQVAELLSEQTLGGIWQEQISDGLAMLRVLLQTEQTEVVSDLVSERFSHLDGFRTMLFTVEATLPKLEEEEPEEPEPVVGEEEPAKPAIRARISREELYADVSKGTQLNVVYLVTVFLSSVVAAIGLMRGDVAVVIGAMVIAPLLSPNVALALAATLGDLDLARAAAKAGGAGLVTALACSILIGFLFPVDPSVREIAVRTQVGMGDVILALAAGSAGALAFTTGVPAGLIGVMVAVALLPPLVTAGLLAGKGDVQMALGAALLFAANVACVNLSGVVTFLVQGIQPRSWWEAAQAKRATRVAIGFWVGLLVIFLALIYLHAHR